MVLHSLHIHHQYIISYSPWFFSCLQCYQNTIYQCLSHTVKLRNLMTHNGYSDMINPNSTSCGDMIRGEWQNYSTQFGKIIHRLHRLIYGILLAAYCDSLKWIIMKNIWKTWNMLYMHVSTQFLKAAVRFWSQIMLQEHAYYAYFYEKL